MIVHEILGKIIYIRLDFVTDPDSDLDPGSIFHQEAWPFGGGLNSRECLLVPSINNWSVVGHRTDTQKLRSTYNAFSSDTRKK